MPPKRKAGGAAKAGGKKAKKDEAADEAPKTIQDAVAALKQADMGKKSHKPDQYFPYKFGAQVHEDFDCMLNQTNIGHNNNKYYVIQVLKVGSNYYAWNRWGRVGEPGANALKGPFGSADPAIKEFCKKFSDKTKNKWENRASFKPVPGKYTLIEMADEDETDAGPVIVSSDGKDIAKCTLDAPTQVLMKLIFDNDMFKEAMKKFDIDVKKMPLGKLSKTQIAKGFECLDELEEALNKKKPKKTLMDLTSRFYTLIPHDFGRRVPPVIDNAETLREKMDMLLILETYTKETGNQSGWRVPKIKHIWKVDRDGEDTRFKAHDSLGNRKLLWHGTNVAVVAAILKSGLRIMPHSGGRVGRGIYFASENSKSAGYVRTAGNTGIMFLNEVVLGKEHHITRDDSSLTKAPPGYDCIIAKGWNEPDPKKDTSIQIEGKKVTVPQGKPVSQSAYNRKSSFDQSEYLIYKESQNRIRYLLLIDF
ncbi:hypothetical protein KUTeg_020249 [Tegillarca granosa]|uniref:Poly [ADP-ribose] polymerase n=1 Tax=Tegillarca granosa TaxID=220873 RepID=A0ABQ9EBJ9_TEGGR|nr:hypothetical protein KUTeg_020249 [Tegillarca granosa]